MRELETVFFGGGTPSLMPAADLARIVDALAEAFGLAERAEISIEADPGTFDANTVEAWASTAGINRVSVGVQSFDDDMLKRCGRSHDASQARRAAHTLADGVRGVRSWSLDLMSGLPGLDAAGWERTLHEAIAFAPPHVSVYDLQVEQGTAFGKWYTPGLSPLPSDDDAAGMYRAASARFQGVGYEHYEISSYAQPGHRCAHNLTYWRNERFFGFGVGATSFDEANMRVARPRTVAEYTSWLGAFESSAGGEAYASTREGDGGAERSGESDVDDADADATSTFIDELICRMRLRCEPFRIEEAVTRVYGVHVWKALESVVTDFERRGLVEIFHRNGSTAVRLTDPDGFLLSNEVLSSILSALPDEEDEEEDARKHNVESS